MDTDSYRCEQITTHKTKIGKFVPYVIPLFQPIWIRFCIYSNTVSNKFLLDYYWYFLLPISTVFYTLFFILS